MNDNITFRIELAIKPEDRERFTALAHEMAAHIEAHEPGTVAYEFFLNGNGTGCHLHERFADSDAVMAHLEQFGEHFAPRFQPLVETTGFIVYGNAGPSVKAALADASPTYAPMTAGFARFTRG